MTPTKLILPKEAINYHPSHMCDDAPLILHGFQSNSYLQQWGIDIDLHICRGNLISMC
jgi:hypothetical protein